ncbi:hypothetical protein QUA93_32510 [Microcoleus sp. F10-B6]
MSRVQVSFLASQSPHKVEGFFFRKNAGNAATQDVGLPVAE